MSDILTSLQDPTNSEETDDAIMEMVINKSLNASGDTRQENRDITTSYVNFISGNSFKYKSTGVYNLSGNASLVIPDSTWSQFSEQAKTKFIELINIQDNYTSLESLEIDINEYLGSIENSDVNLEEKLALISGGHTILKSNQYWAENLDEWLSLTSDSSAKRRIALGWRDYVRADVGGAVIGGFMCDRGGAIAGSAAGGVGAIPGALAGAAGGAIAGGCGASAVSIIFSLF